MNIPHDIQAILTGVSARQLGEMDGQLRRHERAWNQHSTEETLERYLVALLRASNGPHSVTMDNRVLSIRIMTTKSKLAVYYATSWSVSENGHVIHKGWGPKPSKEAGVAAKSMFEDIL